MKKGLELLVQSSLKHNLGISKAFLEEIVQKVGKDEGAQGTVSISFVGKQKIRSLNKKYRKKDKVTDILSFPAQEDDGFIRGESEDLGDIFLCYPRLLSQAKRYGHSLKDETRVLVVHGLLHLVGYDHETDKDYSKMKKVEDRIIQQLT